MYQPTPVVSRVVRTQKLSWVKALEERKRAQARAAAARAAAAAPAAAPSAAAAAPAAPVQPSALRPARNEGTSFEHVAGPRREAVPARAPRSRLWEVDDAVLEADIMRVVASGDDLVSLVAAAGSTKAVLRRVLNGAPLRPAEVYRAWCAELRAAHAQRRPLVWRNVFGALPNAALPGAPTGGAASVKDYCRTFLAAYLAAHPEDTQEAPPGASGASASGAAQQAASALHQKVPSEVQPYRHLQPPAAPSDAGSCPPTPFVARGGLADGCTTALLGLAADCVLQAHVLEAASARLAEAWASDGDDGDVVMTPSVDGAPVAANKAFGEVDDDVVYVKTTMTRHDGVEIMIID